MKYLNLLACFFFLHAIILQAQSEKILQGKVIASDTNQPLPSANIRVGTSNKGTATNSHGKFAIKPDSLPAKLRISYVGYHDTTVTVTKEITNLHIKLQPSVIVSDELVVTDQYEVNLIKKTIDHVMENKDYQIFANVFYRQKTRSDSIYTEFIETFYNSKLSMNGIESWNVSEGRYARIPQENLRYTIFHENFSSISTLELIDQKPYKSNFVWPIRKDAENYYDFYLEERVKNKNQTLAKIRFEPKESIDKPVFRGHVMIDVDNLVIHRLYATISDPMYNPIQPNDRKRKTENTVLNIEINMNGQKAPYVFPEIINIELAYDLIKKKGLFGTIDFRRRIKAESMSYIYNFKKEAPTSTTHTGKVKSKTDYAKIDEASYDPEFWENHPIIKRTPIENEVIRSFEKYGAFGKLLDNYQSQ